MAPSSVLGSSVLGSLRQYDAERLHASFENNATMTTDVKRIVGSNLDILRSNTTNADWALCHISSLFPFTGSPKGDYILWEPSFENAAAVALAAHHLNVGDGSIVPEIDGLNSTCDIKFTLEFADTEFQAQTAMGHVMKQIHREAGSTLRRPCAFVGAVESPVSVPMSIVTGLFGYPQVSGASTSTDLNNRENHPLFARTIPSDADNVIPAIKYFAERLQLSRLAVIYQIGPYGDTFLRSLHTAAQKFAPDMKIEEILLKDRVGSIERAISELKASGINVVFCLVSSVHDELMVEAYNQGVVGNANFGWFFGGGFLGTLNGRTFEKDSPLQLAYQGSGSLEVTGGIPGFSKQYDKFTSAMQNLKNSNDLRYLGSLFPTLNNHVPPFIESEDFLRGPLKNSFSVFFYEATIALGLSACNAASNNLTLTGQAHFNALLTTPFTGISGKVELNQLTGTRKAETTTYKVVNYVSEVQNDADLVAFQSLDTDLYRQSTWKNLRGFTFNDGTSKIPQNKQPLPTPIAVRTVAKEPSSGLIFPWVIIGVLALVCILFVAMRWSKKKMDKAWQIDKQDLEFEDPPKVIGSGEFGDVLQAKYKGMDSAVKLFMTPDKKVRGNGLVKSRRDWQGSIEFPKETPSDDTFRDEGYLTFGMTTVRDSGLSVRRMSMTGEHTIDNIVLSDSQNKSLPPSPSEQKKELRRIIEEMKHLSRLRHPCVASLMGAIIDPGIEPIVVMEYIDQGSLSDFLRNETLYIEASTLFNVLSDISEGMRFLHSANPQVVHGDLKGANVLMDRNFRGKIVDFGLKGRGCSGTPYWMAPELLRGEATNSTKTDVFSFGVLLYEVYSRQDPYEGEDPAKVLHHIVDLKVQKRPPKPSNMPPPMQSLMSDCLVDDNRQRPQFLEIDARLKRLNAESILVEGETSGSFDGGQSSISLSDIFPLHIAEALKAGRPIQPEHRNEVTIFFSDIVGFTDISATLPAQKIASMLDRLYTKFDELSRKYDIFKVETIGDAYMAVTNLVKDQPRDHAKRIAQFAIEAIHLANDTLIDEEDPTREFVNIRVGFHSGPVVADVVGTRNLRYTLFGDTVNTASRMESNSRANKIHCSSEAADILVKQCPEIPLRPRGQIAIKGKGEMYTYWVNERGQKSMTIDEVKKADRRLLMLQQKSILKWASSHEKMSRRQPPFAHSSLGMSFKFSSFAKSVSGRNLLSFSPPSMKNMSRTSSKNSVDEKNKREGALGCPLSVVELGKLEENDSEELKPSKRFRDLSSIRRVDSLGEDIEDELANEMTSELFRKSM